MDTIVIIYIVLFLYTWFLATLHGIYIIIYKCNVSQHVLQCIPIRGTMSFMPHKIYSFPTGGHGNLTFF